jgi:hypothetical protein
LFEYDDKDWHISSLNSSISAKSGLLGNHGENIVRGKEECMEEELAENRRNATVQEWKHIFN